ncbi:MFS transporter [Acidilobus sp.]|uniref:MFS transporter n=1 Tax=Acidilobus sp. TaxID=1872109 RepID=UPI003D04413C
MNRRDWMISLIPFNLAMGPLSTLVTLEVYELRGGAVGVSYAISAGTAASILASLIWGFALDRYDRKDVLTVGLAGTLLSLLALAFSSSLAEVAAYYAAASLFSSAVGMAVSVLIIDTIEKSRWSSAYSRYNMLSSVGYLSGDVAAAIASGLMPTRAIVEVMTMITAASVAWASLTVPRSPIPFERESLLHIIEGFLLRVKLVPTFFLRLPSKSTFKSLRLIKLGRSPAAYVPMLFIAITIFYVSSGIFNTLYPYGLRVLGLSRSEVFLVISAGMAAQVAGFQLAPKIIAASRGNAGASYRALLARGASYIGIGVATAAGGGPVYLLGTGLTLYPLAAGIAFATFFTASNVMVFEVLKGNREGRGLGLYSTLTGSAYFAGSLASGFLANSVGFGYTYVIAGAMLGGSAYIFNELRNMA